jgi:glycosyltransferase involved in cell wall biosynthesis
VSTQASFFVQDLRGGGAERSVVRLANGFAARGIATDLVLMRALGPFLDEVDSGVRVVDLKVPRAAGAAFALRRYVKGACPRALFSAMTHTNILAVLATRLMRDRPRLVVVEHNQFDANKALKRGLVRLSYDLVPLLYRHADVVAGVSEGVAGSIARAARLPRADVRVLHNPIVTPELGKRAAGAPDHPWFDGSAPVLVAVGRLAPQKNYPLLLEAMALLKDRTPARLVILGEGPDCEALAAQVARLGLDGRVDLAGFRPNPFPFMRACSLYVMSSDWEGLPTVLVEALALGAPIVSTDCISGPAEILEQGRHGMLVPTGNAAALADAIMQTLGQPGDSAPRVARAQAFSADRAVERYIEAGGLVEAANSIR